MLKTIKGALLPLAISTLLLPSAYAENKIYVGGGFSALDYSEDVVSDDASLSVIYGRVGMHFNENFSGELRAGFGVGDDDVNVLGTNVNVELKNTYGAYFRAGIPTETVFPYVILGYTSGKVEGEIAGLGSADESESSFSYGIGADVSISEGIKINAEYMDFLDSDGTEVTGFNIGLTFDL